MADKNSIYTRTEWSSRKDEPNNTGNREVNLRIFGCGAMVHVPKEKRKMLDAKSKNCVFVGYLDHKKGYKFYDSVTRSMVVSRDVNFLESQFPCH